MLTRFVSWALALLALAPAPSAQCAVWDDRYSSFIPGMNGPVLASVVFDDGSGPALFAAGQFTSAGGALANRIAKWNGTRWLALSSGAGGGAITALDVFDDGSGPALFAGGTFTSIGGITANRVAKWDGASWSALAVPANGTNGTVNCLAAFDDGTGPALYVGGSFTNAGGAPAGQIAKWDGSSWSLVGPPSSSNGAVLSLRVFDAGSGPALYATGSFTNLCGTPANSLARWDGTTWAPVGTGLNGQGLTLHDFDDGSGPALYVGGTFSIAGGVPADRIAKWNGVSWSALGSGTNGTVNALASFDDGSGPKLYAGGSFTVAGRGTASRIARWNGASWSALGSPLEGTNVSVATLTSFDDGSGPALYVGGPFFSVAGETITYIARWTGASWDSVDPGGAGVDGSITSLALFDDGSGEALHAGGFFTHAGVTPAFDVAKWDGTQWFALGSGMNNTVSALHAFDDGSGAALFAGGVFGFAGGVPASRVARWDGASWSALGSPGSGTDGTVTAFETFDDGSGPALIVGGAFANAGGIAVNNLAKWDGTSWSSLPGTNGPVRVMRVFDDGSGPALYVGGTFTTAGGITALRIAKWDGTTWSALGRLGSGFNAEVSALLVHDDGSGPALFAGGQFTQVNTTAINRVAKWDGTSWSPLGTGTSGQVRAFTVFDDGSGAELVATGAFLSAGGVTVKNLASWDGTSWSSIGAPNTGVDGGAVALAVFDDGADGDADLYVGGGFIVAGGLNSERIAQWHSCASEFLSFCHGDGSSGACPCANAGVASRGCDNSGDTGGALLSATGSKAADTVVLTQSHMLPTSLSIFSQGTVQLGTAVAFGDGLRCVGGALKRLYQKNAVAGSASAPGAGDPSIGARSAALGDPLFPGAVRYYYVYYRDPDLLLREPARQHVQRRERVAGRVVETLTPAHRA